DRVDQRVVEDADLLPRRLVEQMAKSRNPVLVSHRGLAQHRVEQAGLAKAPDLLVAAELLDPEIGRIDRVRIDEHGRNAGAAEHGGSCRAGQPSADDGNVGVAHGKRPATKPSPCAANGKQRLSLDSRLLIPGYN